MNKRFITINGKTINGYPWEVPTTLDEGWEIIKKERQLRQLEGGFMVGAKWYHSDFNSRIKYLGLVLLGASLPSGIMWKTMDNTFQELTPALVMQIFQGAASSDSVLFQLAESKKANLTLETLETYDATIGWPQAYWEVT